MALIFREVSRTEVGERARKTMSHMLGLPEDLDDDKFDSLVFSKYGSIEKLKDKAKQKDWKAQSLLSVIYREGIPDLGIEKDLDMAIGLMESSFENGNDFSYDRFVLGALHDRKGTVFHRERAYKLYLEAAQLGEIHAQLHLAEMYRCGEEGVIDENVEEAFKWYRRAAGEELHEFKAQSSSLHSSYFVQGNKRHLAIDYKFVALKYLHKYYMCGDCPEGEPQPVKALYYLKKAAEIGDPEAQKDLGLAYLTGGSGYPKDLDKAKRWLGKAAKNGQQEAKQVLEDFDKEDIVDDAETEKDQLHGVEAARQLLDVFRMKDDQTIHPYLIKHKMLFDESMFTHFPNSPTAKRYLKAFELVKNGLEIIEESNLKDSKGISMLAWGYLYENSIFQSFPMLKLADHSEFPLLGWIDEILESNQTFFEGLLMMIALCPFNTRFNFESCKLDLRRTMAVSNLIHLIKKAEPDKPPKQEPYNFEEDYSSWLHMLYYFLGSHFIITNCYKDGAEAFDMALKCCPNYFEAKLPLGHCLMNLKFTKHQREYVSNDTEKLLEMFAIPQNQRIIKGDYLSWTDHQLEERAKQLFMEYIEEAPECDKKYPDGYYHLALLYFREGNIEEAVKWKNKGEDSEEKRLPFLQPVDFGSKSSLALLDICPCPKTAKSCSNRKCHDKRRGRKALQLCPCRTVSYCGRECQAEDWKQHRKTCSVKKKR